ncbi:SusD/RagB family nutrient-binding outer membrane lipoprotein [Pedobacter hartonius]|uniref:Starch-binding associating with outer membrane n=1 Tax=Pedobacter hartonius TaxID=425514 RepID=A0A1H4EYX2_9SPHI|nr:SusD/RagB family nutrient-binding outer membrane lipoprotein [Pedobacter hartonius]SEA89818.1 Starch-binding associating with outer membrane [Pedobacter hartonius]
MNNKLKLLYITVAVIFASCTKDYLDINTNPNKPVDVVPGLVLTNALNFTAKYTTGSTNFYQFASTWIGYWNYSGAVSAFAEERSYQFTTNYGPAVTTWDSLYHNLKDYDYVEKKSRETGNQFYTAVAKTMKAYDYQNLVDIFGNIPYSDALRSTESIRPKYDKDQDIYEDLAKQLDTAANLFKSNAGKVASADAAYDIMYAGNAEKWGRFANTLKLRILLRQSEIPGRTAYIQTEMARINANGLGFIGVGEGGSVNPGYTNSAKKQNPFWSNFGYSPVGKTAPTDGHRYYIASTYGLNFYQSNNDPRMPKLYTTINDGNGTTYSGSTFGPTASSDDNPQFKSAIGTGLLKSADMAQPLLTDFESLFLQAETAHRSYLAANARSLYESAVQQSFTYLAAGSAATYLAANSLSNWDLAPDKLTLIMTQKWAAMNGINDMESWADYRRLNIPSDIPISNNPAASTRKVPVRLLYPQSEYNYNPDNVLAQGTISQFTTRIFWDVN